LSSSGTHESSTASFRFLRGTKDFMDAYAIWAFLLLGVGLLILLAEIFLPSGGILGGITVVVLALALWFAWAAWGKSHPAVWWSFFGVTLFLVPCTVLLGLYWLPYTPLGRKILLEAPQAEDVAPYANEVARLERQIGRIGRTASQLNPGGFVTIDGERLHAFTEGLMVAAGTDVEIVAVRGSRVVVRPVTSASPRQSAAILETESLPESATLDFEIPEESDRSS
jgi:membrane-bound serine protease (ClpP class)